MTGRVGAHKTRASAPAPPAQKLGRSSASEPIRPRETSNPNVSIGVRLWDAPAALARPPLARPVSRPAGDRLRDAARANPSQE